jgi:hypothetical protein
MSMYKNNIIFTNKIIKNISFLLKIKKKIERIIFKSIFSKYNNNAWKRSRLFR